MSKPHNFHKCDGDWYTVGSLCGFLSNLFYLLNASRIPIEAAEFRVLFIRLTARSGPGDCNLVIAL
jgi:hypothetical protein